VSRNAARLRHKRVAKRNQAKEEKVLAADNDVSPTDEVAREAAMNTLRAFDAVAAGDTVPMMVLNKEAEALDADADSVAGDDAALPKVLNEDPEALAAEAAEDALC